MTTQTTSQWIVEETSIGNGDCRITCPDCGGHGWTGEETAFPDWRPEPVRHTTDCPRNPDRVRSIGMIEGRHPLPVDAYLLPADAASVYGFHSGIYAAAYNAAYEAAQAGEFELYLTGLTVAAIGAVDGMRSAGIPAVVRNYDAATSAYVRIVL